MAVLSDKQKALPENVTAVLPDARHHFCHSHYLKNLAEPLAKADSAFNVEVRKAVRREVGLLIRAKKALDVPQPSLLTVTGLLPDSRSPTTEAADFQTGAMATQNSEAAVVDEAVTQLLRHTRYLLTLKGRSPFRLAGIETYQPLQSVIGLTDELLAHRYESRLTRLSDVLSVALIPFTREYQVLRQGETWLRDIDHVLEPANDNLSTGQQVAQRLRAYLDGLSALPDLPPRLDAFRHHLDGQHQLLAWPIPLLRHRRATSHQQRPGKPLP